MPTTITFFEISKQYDLENDTHMYEVKIRYADLGEWVNTTIGRARQITGEGQLNMYIIDNCEVHAAAKLFRKLADKLDCLV